MIGPSAPSPATPAQTPIALRRSIGSMNTLVNSDNVEGMMKAPPMPMSDRVAMSAGADVANELSRLPRPKMLKSDDEGAVAAEAVAEAAGGEEEPGEHDRVRVDDPLQLARRGVESAGRLQLGEGRERDVEDRVVEHEHEQAHAQDGKAEPAPAVGEVAVGGDLAHGQVLTPPRS